jgi:hypothetical protein
MEKGEEVVKGKGEHFIQDIQSIREQMTMHSLDYRKFTTVRGCSGGEVFGGETFLMHPSQQDSMKSCVFRSFSFLILQDY